MLTSSSSFTGTPCLLLKQSANHLNQKSGIKLISVKHLCHRNNVGAEHSISAEQPKKRLLVKRKVAENTSPSKSSILCSNCDGNGMVQCSQCKGDGVNSKDHFNGQFKAGEICWLCRGNKEMLCGECNGAGFIGGFMNTMDV